MTIADGREPNLRVVAGSRLNGLLIPSDFIHRNGSGRVGCEAPSPHHDRSRSMREKEKSMKNDNAMAHPPKRRIWLMADATALAMVLAFSLSEPAHAAGVTPPPVPPEIEVPAGSKAFLEGHAEGTQNYVCLPSGLGFAWTLFTPQATLFSDNDKQIMTHFFSPNPFESGTVRATWEDSKDTSMVWGQVIQPSTDPHFVAPGAIPWLLIKEVGVREGPTGGDTLTATSHIHRLNTQGGSAPSTGCAMSTDVGKRAYVPYTADYFFYTNGDAGDDD